MIDLEEEGYPAEIINAVKSFQDDVDIDGHSMKGGNGYVLFGYHKLLEKRIAYKFYYYGEDSHEEVKLLSAVDSNNILKIHNAQTIENGYAFFMTDELAGGDLDNYINAPFIKVRPALCIVNGILTGLGDMHKDENRLLHRDLKPANILIDQDNNPLIADFGSVKKIPDGQNFVNGSKHAALYRPPESYHNEYYKSSDIFQVGIVLYQLLGGYLPYDGTAYLKKKQKKEYSELGSNYDKSKFVDDVLRDRASKGKLLDMNSLPIFVEKRIRKIINKATNPDPDQRFQNTAEFSLAIHKLGTVDNWVHFDNEYSISNFNKKDFKIVHKSKGKYCCMKTKEGENNWRREGKVKEGSELDTLQNLILHLKK